MQTTRPIVLIEDDEVDVLSTRRAFDELSIPNPLVIFKNGEEAIEALHTEGINPGFIILDLNMPKMNGFELLKTIKEASKLKAIPVVVLTTSSSHLDIERSFQNQAAGYMVKPMDFTNFKEVIRKIYDYWNTCELPN